MATVDGKKEEFRQYLEKSGVIDALTKGEREPEAQRGQMRLGCLKALRALVSGRP